MKSWAAPGDMTATVEMDFRVGGAYRIDMRAPDGTVRRVGGTYRVIEPPKRLVYTWRWADSPNFPETTVTVEFKPAPNGGTELVLLHEGLPDENSRQQHSHGWEGCLTKLEGMVSRS